MSFTAISGKPGLYRHAATGFIVHEVYNTVDVIKCNGVMVEYDSGAWIWVAGRDLRDLMYVRNVTSLVDLVRALAYDDTIMGTMNVIQDDCLAAAQFPMFAHGSRVVTAASGFPGTRADTVYSTAKIFGLVNNMHAGRGHGGAKWATKNLSWYPTDIVANMFMRSAVPGATLKNIYGGPYVGYNNAYVRTDDRATLLGTAVVTIPLGCTWETYFARVSAAMPNSGESEVKAKCAETTSLILSKIKAASPIPVCYVPVEIHAGGVFKIVDAKAAAGSTVTDAHGTSRAATHILRGGVFYDETGFACTAAEWIAPDMTYVNAATTTSFTHRTTDDMQAVSGSTTSPAYNAAGEFCTPVRLIDGVRLERILGGAAGGVMGATSEAALPAGAPNVTSAALIAQWANALRFSSRSATFERQALETDEAYAARLTALAPTAPVEPAVATRLTQWDGHGFTAAHGLMAFVAALDGGKSDSSWLTALWPARRRLACAYAPRSAGSYPAIGYAAFAPEALLQ